MPSDPLREVLQKVVQERQDKLQSLLAEQAAAADEARRSELARQIEETEAELKVSQQALQQSPAIQRGTDSDGLVLDPSGTPEAKAGPSRAALEAQIRELQSQLLDQARTVQLARPAPDPKDVEALEKTRVKLAAAMRAIGAAEMPAFSGELPPKPTPSQQSEADNLIRQSRVAKMRGQGQMATDLLRKAAEVAPGAVSVLEALGDDMMERGLAKPAADTYSMAFALSPENTAVERKYAMAVAKSRNVVSFEEVAEAKLGDRVFAPGCISLVVPGLGQMVLGQYIPGATYMVAWLVTFVWAFINFHNLKGSRDVGFMPFLPIILSLVLQVAAALSCLAPSLPKSKRSATKRPSVDRPKPPVDLPFE